MLLKQTKLRELLKIPDQALFEQLFDVCTLEEVIREVKDEQARKYIETGLEFPLQVKSGSGYVQKADLDFVQNFAKDTGDFKSLSQVDQLVIALGVRLSKERDDFGNVRKEPLPLQEFKPSVFQEDYARREDGEFSDYDSEDSEEAKPVDDGWNEVAEDRQTKRTKKRA